MGASKYCALIRTCNSAATLPATLQSLAGQTLPPSKFIFVDSGSVDETFSIIPEGSVVQKYNGEKFNYSSAINQGIDFVDTQYVLIVSSHTALKNPRSIEYGIKAIENDDAIGAAYFVQELGTLDHSLINAANFSGFNGVWNTCGLYRFDLLKRRRFREEVFSAEDQEWSRWLFEQGMSVARVSGGGMQYNSATKYPFRKRFDEHRAVAQFARPDMLAWRHIARIAYRVVKVYPWQNAGDRLFYLRWLAWLVSRRLHVQRRKPSDQP